MIPPFLLGPTHLPFFKDLDRFIDAVTSAAYFRRTILFGIAGPSLSSRILYCFNWPNITSSLAKWIALSHISTASTLLPCKARQLARLVRRRGESGNTSQACRRCFSANL